MNQPARWLTDHAALIPRAGAALDLASGRGRHALWLAQHGLQVMAVDRDPTALENLTRDAHALGVGVETRLLDLEGDDADLGVGAFDVIVAVHYLHRPLFPALLAALRPDGLLVYETFTRAQAALGKPTNPDFLLESAELLRLVDSLDVLDAREGFFEGRHIASVVARKRALDRRDRNLGT